MVDLVKFEVHLVEVLEEEDTIKCLNIFSHPGEIWCLEPSPNDLEKFFTYYDAPTPQSLNEGATLWSMNDEDSTLKELAKIPDISAMKELSWNSESPEDLLCVQDKKLDLFKVGEAGISHAATVGEAEGWWRGRWHPLHPQCGAASVGGSVRGWDSRTKQETYCFPRMDAFVRDFDFNPNKVTGGDEGNVSFWDSRRVSAPIASFSAHSHWVWSVRYNRYHDQLVLSASTDSLVNLWNAISVSSASAISSSSTHWDKKKQGDQLIKTFDEHEDSVYSIAWGTSPWLFASLSYDGRVVINYVPKESQDQIMMR